MKLRHKSRLLGVAAGAVALGMVMAGCSTGGEGGDGSAGESMTLRLGHILAAGDPTDLGAHEFAKIVEEKTDGRITIEVFPASQLGSGPEQIEQVQAGALDLFVGGIAWFEAFDGMEDLQIFSIPPIFQSTAEPKKVLDSEVGERLFNTLAEDHGIEVLAYNWWWPPRNILSTRPVETRADLQGLLLRVPEVQMYVTSWSELGAVPSPIAWGEVYSSLQQGVIEAAEAGLALMYDSGLHEVAKNLTLTNHTIVPVTFITSTDLYDSLTPEDQQILRDAAEEAGLVSNAGYEAVDAEMVKKFQDAGVTVYEIDVAEFFEPIGPLTERLEAEGTWSKGLKAQLDQILGR